MLYEPERPLDPPPERFIPTCPCCGEVCEKLYTGYLHVILGCDVCLTAVDAAEYLEESYENR